MAQMLQFPLARRASFVRKHANMISKMSPLLGEEHLRRQLKIQADTMARRCIPSDRIAKELRALENAIRAELWRRVLLPEKA